MLKDAKPWSKEWGRFNGHYEKEFCDVILYNGVQLNFCWPNAGYMNPCKKEGNPEDYRDIPYSNVAFVRLTHSKRFDSDNGLTR